MLKLKLTDSDREAIAEALDDPELRERFQRRLLAVRMHDLGVPHGTIAATLNVSQDTVTNYLKLYLEGSIQGLLEDRYYRPVSSVEPFLPQIIEAFTADPAATCSEAAARIEQLTGIKLSDSQTGRIMRRLGMKYQKSAAVPGQGDAQMQFDFLKRSCCRVWKQQNKGSDGFFSLMPPTSCWVPSWEGSGRSAGSWCGAGAGGKGIVCWARWRPETTI